jgi:hypothetical protein
MAGKTPKKSARTAKKAAANRVAARPTLAAGGNPQIAKAEAGLDPKTSAVVYVAVRARCGRGLRLPQGEFCPF